MIGQALRPIEGNAERVRTLSRTLRSAAWKLTSMNSVLVGIKAGATWESPAGEAFEAAVQASPPVLDALIDRYAGAAVALMAFSEELERAQLRADAAIDRHEAATKTYLHLEDLVYAARGTSGEPLLVQRQNDAMAAVMSAERDHGAAWTSFEEADRRLARRLRHLADDILDDSWHYGALATMDEFAQETSSIPVSARKFPVVGTIGVAGDVAGAVSSVGLRVFYGEGSWKQIGVNTAAGGLGLGAKGMKNGAMAGARPVSRLADGRRAYVGEDLSSKERFLIGTREELHRKYPKIAQRLDPGVPLSRMVVPLATLPATVRTTGVPLSEKAANIRRFAVAKFARKADELFLDDWRAVTAGGAGAQRMFVAGSTLERAVPKLQEGATNALSGSAQRPAPGHRPEPVTTSVSRP